MAGKEEIVTRIAQKSGMTKRATYKFMEAFKDVLEETLAKGERFHFHKVFTMEPIQREACIRHNPRTQEEIELPACIKVKTVIGTELRKRLNTKKGNERENVAER